MTTQNTTRNHLIQRWLAEMGLDLADLKPRGFGHMIFVCDAPVYIQQLAIEENNADYNDMIELYIDFGSPCIMYHDRME